MNEKLANIVMKFEPLYEIPGSKKAGDFINENLEVKFSNGRNVKVSELTKNAPLLLVFIKGTWCPFCRLHMQRLRLWAEKLKNKATIIVVSSESMEVIQNWQKSNSFSYLFCADDLGELASEFGVWIDYMGFAQVSTFLVENGGKIRASFVNRRDEGLSVQNFSDKIT